MYLDMRYIDCFSWVRLFHHILSKMFVCTIQKI